MGSRGTEPNTGFNQFLKTFFCMHKTDFFLAFIFSLSYLIHFVGTTYNRNKI